MNAQDASHFSTAFSSLDSLIETVQQAVPPLDVDYLPTGRLLLIHTLIHGASIQLHNRFFLKDDISRAKCLAAARSVVQVLDVGNIQKYHSIDPVIGVSRLLFFHDPRHALSQRLLTAFVGVCGPSFHQRDYQDTNTAPPGASFSRC